jgi:hypothetical protein
MNTPNQLDQTLEALRQEHRSIQPPAALEEAILERTRLEPTPPPTRRFPLYAWSLALAAAIAVAIILVYPRPSHRTLETRTTPLPAPKSIETPSPVKTTVQPIRLRPHATRRPTAHSQGSPSPFVPLPTSMGLPEPAQAMLIRTRIDTNSLRSYGLTPPPPGAPLTILAEFLVGDDGLPRAIRLVP